MTDDIARLSAGELIAGYRDGSLSPVEATRAALARIEKHDPALNAFRLVDAESALEEARKSEERWRIKAPRGRVDGVPTSIKDLLLTKGWSTPRGSKTVDQDQPWEEDAPCVARLREHGAVLLGKTTTPEFGWKGLTDSPLTGITRNPWNPERTPGGSSGGAAVAVATGMGALAIGTDGGGSIRIPAGFTGVFGFKASGGQVPAYPPSPFGTLAHVGDSRVYRLRDGQLDRLTRDHSWVEEQIRVGALSETAARRHPWRNIVTRALSGSEDLEVDIQEVALQSGDRLLLCSDGVFTVLDDDQISEVLRRDTDLDQLCGALIQGANDGGG
ncbi:MAG: hypothetical protein IH924_07745, partial [Proteobacteria bacterium]|nr:hypothetical protein [Pseudomonadota bacterium]